jgi:hypothetical protein
MSTGAMITMLIFMAVLWGGFALCLMLAVRREACKSSEPDGGEA